MINATLMAIAFTFAALVAGLLVAAGYELGRRSSGTAPPPRPSSLPFSRAARAPERKRPFVNSDERAWQLEKEEREGKVKPPTP